MSELTGMWKQIIGGLTGMWEQIMYRPVDRNVVADYV